MAKKFYLIREADFLSGRYKTPPVSTKEYRKSDIKSSYKDLIEALNDPSDKAIYDFAAKFRSKAHNTNQTPPAQQRQRIQPNYLEHRPEPILQLDPPPREAPLIHQNQEYLDDDIGLARLFEVEHEDELNRIPEHDQLQQQPRFEEEPAYIQPDHIPFRDLRTNYRTPLTNRSRRRTQKEHMLEARRKKNNKRTEPYKIRPRKLQWEI